MRRQLLIAGALFFGASALFPGSLGAFTSGLKSSAITAAVTPTGTSFYLQASTLPAAAFFGKNAVIPVQLVNPYAPLNPRTISASLVYQLANNGVALGPPVSVPIALSPSAANPNALSGSAVVPEGDLLAIQSGGELNYVILATQGGNSTMLASTGLEPAPGSLATLPAEAFRTSISTSVCSPVSPSGAVVVAPDLFVNDGKTTVAFSPGSISAPGTLCIEPAASTGWPPGPSGTTPAAVYTITLTGATLGGSAQLVLSYPSDANGKILNQSAAPGDLALYWLGPEGVPASAQSWRVLSRSTVDTTLHTVSGVTGHFSTFALFATGQASYASDLRPAERLITPNGDGKNDDAFFGQGIDEVNIFDIHGRRVKAVPGPNPRWDGTNDDGAIVPIGVYLYQFTVNGQRVSGVIGVAK